MIIVIGEVLFDEFPDYRRLGGAPLNFAYHMKQLGFPVRFISRVGDDPSGKEILAHLSENGFDTDDIQIDPHRPTGMVRVSVDAAGVPDFHIVPDVAYDYIEFSDQLQTALNQHPDLLYFGTLIQRTLAGQNNLHRVLASTSPVTRTLYDVNFRPDCFTKTSLVLSLAAADIIKLNLEELEVIMDMTGQFNSSVDGIETIMQQYEVNTIILTMGGSGGEWFDLNGHFKGQPAVVENLKDTVGAGDAFASVVAAGVLKNWHPTKTLGLANAFAARICETQGALPATNEPYQPIIKELKNP